MKKASLKLSVGVLSLVAAGAVSGEAAARIAPDAFASGAGDDSTLDIPVRGVRFFSDPDDGLSAPVPPALPAIAVAPQTPSASTAASTTATPKAETAAVATSPEPVATTIAYAAPKVTPSAPETAKPETAKPETATEEIIRAGVARPVADIAMDAAAQAPVTQAPVTQAPVILTPEQSLQAERDRLN
ncbi:MAG: hypothetical protein QM667_13325, partial [Asticcacaulis sp.]